MVLKKDFSAYDISKECSEQAQENLKIICDNGKYEDFEQLMTDYEVETIDEVADILHHEWQDIFKALDIEEE